MVHVSDYNSEKFFKKAAFINENLRSAKAEYLYISDGTEKVIEPKFTFYGYRYVKVEGIENLTVDDFEGVALYSDISFTGRLATGNEKVNRLIENTVWGLKGNFIDTPTDCPQRDERLGWTGDAQVFAGTACYLTDAYPFYRKYLWDMAREQKKYGGMVPIVIPSVGQTQTSSVWGDAACIIPWKLYEVYGDISILEEQFESMCSWVDYVENIDKNSGWGEHFHYGDWLALDAHGGPESTMGATDVDFIAYVYYMYSAQLCAKAAGVLGKTEKEEKYEKLALELRQQVEWEYFTPSGRCCIDTQTAQILALKFKLGSNEEKAAERLQKLLMDNHYKLNTGFTGTPLLAPILSENGMGSMSYRLLLNEEYPGWLYEVNLGATTIWERWNSLEPDGSISGTGMNSLNHYSYGSIVEWIYAYAAGLRQTDGCGFKNVYIKPEPDPALKELTCVYDSPAGTYRVKWRFPDKRHLETEVEIPFDCVATLVLPYLEENNVKMLGPGTYNYTYEISSSVFRKYSVDTTLGEILEQEAAKSVILSFVPQVQLLGEESNGFSLRVLMKMFAGMEGVPSGKAMEEALTVIDAALSQVGED